MNTFTMWIRGQECKVVGFVEGTDRHVGIFGDYFVTEAVIIVTTNVDMTDNCGEFMLTAGEERDIDAAFWASRPFDEAEHCARDWREVASYNPDYSENFT